MIGPYLQGLRRREDALLTVLGAAMLFAGLALAPAPVQTSVAIVGGSDVATYEHMVSSLRSGEPYNDMIGQELRLGGYATREVFNRRTPLLWSSLAYMPSPVSRGVPSVDG